MPFLSFTSSQTAGSHFSRAIGLSSNTVPTLSENFGLVWPSAHQYTRALLRYLTFSESQRGQHTLPSGQRKAVINKRQFSNSLKNWMVSCSVFGLKSFIQTSYATTRLSVAQSFTSVKYIITTVSD